MGRFERHLDPQKVAQVLALNIKPHRHASNAPEQPIAHPPAKPHPRGKWPSAAYQRKMDLRNQRRRAARKAA